MKFNKYYLMSAVFCMALASCSDDMTEEQGGNPDNTEQTEGVKDTYAQFNLDFGTTISRSINDGTNNQVNDITFLIFKYNPNQPGGGVLEEFKTVTEVTTETKTQVYAISSGQKKVYALINAGASTSANNSLLNHINAKCPLTLNVTSLSDFEKVAIDINNAKENYILGGSTAMIMSGVSEANLVSGISAESAKKGTASTEEQEAGITDEQVKKNQIEIEVDRLAAKVSMGEELEKNVALVWDNQTRTYIVAATNHTTEVPYTGKEISDEFGKIAADGISYAMYNLNTTEYLLPKKNNYVEDPNYASSNDFTPYFKFVNKDGNVDYGMQQVSMSEVTFKSLSFLKGKASDATVEEAFYIPENTNEWPVKGNTTYAMIEAKFAPDDSRIVNLTDPIQAAAAQTSLLFKNGGKVKKDGSFIYCKDYNIFFPADEEELARVTNNLTSVTRQSAIKYIAAKMISDANVNAQAEQGTNTSNALKAKMMDKPGADNIVAIEKGGTGNEQHKWYATVETVKQDGITVGAQDNAQYFTIAVELGNGKDNTRTTTQWNDTPVESPNIPKNSVTIAVYPTGKCYYRINIENVEQAPSITPARYAVIRNYWYQIDVAKFTDLGYPNPAYAAGVEGDALGADTHVQATIIVKDWSLKNMKPEVGL
ncbi:fimbria major subunit [Phocaeicola sartorii]|uniref:fimbria major subunit n=1 Tax=Phocaeicola sartorii TaxID=671267 RepID=UPI00266F5103|nr:fimbria major subunit [Phocaeicola sartorii]